MEWKEVTKEHFYRIIGKINCHPTAQGKWPYTSIFKTPFFIVCGKTVEGIESKGKKYYLNIDLIFDHRPKKETYDQKSVISS